jgi:serine/threonine-protein kinase 24/25/MST4
MGSSGLTLTGPPSAEAMGEWNFDETIRGTMKGMPVNLDLAGADWEAGYDSEDSEEEDVPWASVRVRVDGQGIGRRDVNVSAYNACLRVWLTFSHRKSPCLSSSPHRRRTPLV